MANTYGTIVTDAGIAALADATAAGSTVPISTCAVGDGGGAYYQPDSAQTALVGQKWQGNLAGVRTNAENAQILEIEIVVPSSAGGFTIREMGVFLDDGTLFAVANTPDIQKTALASGAANETKLVMYIQVVSTANVEFTLDPNVVVATKGINQTIKLFPPGASFYRFFWE
jgi:phage-related tail fiber protein